MRIFPEEKAQQKSLSQEWRDEVAAVVEDAMGIFQQRGTIRDGDGLVWDRLQFPHGFMTIINQKVSRVPTLLVGYDPHQWSTVAWKKVIDELVDVGVYCFMLIAIIQILARRYDK